MAFYIVTAVQLGAMGEVEYIRWRRDHSRSVVAVAEVVEAIDRSDAVEIWFSGTHSDKYPAAACARRRFPTAR